MLHRVGGFLLQARERGPQRIAVVLGVFLAFGCADFAVEWLLNVADVPLAAHGTIDGVIVGGFAGLMAWILLEATRRERDRLRKAVEEEARLNHEIRNALEVIGQAGYLSSDVNLKSIVSDSVQRIDSILKEHKPRKNGEPWRDAS